ncbi:MAG: cytochrome-c oxidase, cbb3-type subunit I, partial [Pseudomonadota bacterium]
MKNGTEAILLGVATFLAFLVAGFAQDALFQAHMWVLCAVLALTTLVLMRRVEFAPAGQSFPPPDRSGYMDEVIRYGVVTTLFWGIVGFLVGVVIAAQLAYPILNIEPWFNFGRLRPLHTSAV